MRAILKLNDDFHIDTSNDATITVSEAVSGALLGTVRIDFADKHQITSDFSSGRGIPHYAQAQAILQASYMVDSFFDDDANNDDEPYSEIECDL